jgi:hypothetical protein
MEIDWNIWDNFCYWNFVPNSTYFKLNLRFLSKSESKRGWTLRDTVLTIANTSVHQPRQGMPQTDLQSMLFNLDDMYRLTLKIEKDMEFQKV